MSAALCFPGLIDEKVLLSPERSFSPEVIDALGPAIETAYGAGGPAAWTTALASSGYANPAQHAAVLLYGLAAHRAFLADHPPPRAVTAHSLGIYAAAAAAGMVSQEASVRLVLAAGEAVQRAQRVAGTVLLAVTGLTGQSLGDVLDREGTGNDVRITHENSTVQHIVSGPEDVLRQLGRRCTAAGAFGATILPFPGVVHRADLAPFADEFVALVDETKFRPPTTRFYSPVDGEPVATADAARAMVRDQLMQPVRFAKTIHRMVADGVGEFVVLGPCAQIVSIIGWNDREARVSVYPMANGGMRP